MIRSAFDNQLGPFNAAPCEAHRANAMSLRGDNDCTVDNDMAAVNGQLLQFGGSVNAVRAQTESGYGAADTCSSSSSAF